MHNQWRGSVYICSLVFKLRLVTWDSDVLPIRANADAPTLAAIVTMTRQTMKLKFILLTIGVFSALFGRGQETKTDILPKENFSVLEGRLGDKPVIGSFNMAYKTYDKKAKYPWCLKIAIGLELGNLFENGLPQKEESEIANRLEDDLLANIQKLGTAHYIGHLFNDTFLDVYIYLADPESVHKYLQTQVNKEGLIRGFGYEINEDPKWTTVQEFMK
jgi:hypothetical protein